MLNLTIPSFSAPHELDIWSNDYFLQLAKCIVWT